MSVINGFIQFKRFFDAEKIHTLVENMDAQTLSEKSIKNQIFSDDFAGLSSHADNPFIYDEGRTKMVLIIGEIYNNNDLKNILIKKYPTHDAMAIDALVVLHMYEEFGTDFLNQIDGMFILVIYDIKARHIIIARDRVGCKPLYYYKNNDYLIFSTKLKGLFVTSFVKKKINDIALCQYLHLTYIPAPLTIFENIYKMEAATYMIVRSGAELIYDHYWDLVYNRNKLITDYSECKKLLRQAVFKSIELRMSRKDSPGAFLSGGVDSSIIVGIMSHLSSKPIDTFTIGYKIKEYDESRRANSVAKYNKTNHHLYFLDHDEILNEVDAIINNFDEPFADSSAIPTYFVSKYSSKYVKTVLTGDAGDELFAGYAKYLIGYYSKIYKNIPSFLKKTIMKRLLLILPDKNSFIRKIHKVVRNADRDLFSQHRDLMCLGFKDTELDKLLCKEYDNKSLDFVQTYYDRFKDDGDEVFQSLYTDFKIVLEGDMLTKVGRTTELASILSRAPLLSKDVIELAVRIPSVYKIDSRNQKIIFKDTFKDLLPNNIINSSKKGFGIPIDYWFRNDLRSDLICQLSKDRVVNQKIFNHKYINQLLEEHYQGKRNRKSELWLLYVFQKWYDNFLHS